MTAYILVDILILGVLAFYGLRGLKKGLVLSVAAALTMIIAISGAFFASRHLTGPAETIIRPIVGDWVGSRAVERIPEAIVSLGDATNPAVYDALREFGVGANTAANIGDTVMSALHRTGANIHHALSYAFVETIARFFTFIFFFLLLTLALAYVSKFLDALASLPLVRQFNKLGGAAGGILFGAGVCWLAVYVLRFLGIFGPDTVASTFLLNMFFNMM